MSIHHHKHEARDGRLRFVQIYHEDLAALAELGPSSLLVYSFLAKYANYSTGQCFPSIDTLATDCNVSRNTVMKAIQKLSDAGLIAVEKERTDHGYDRSIYTVLSKTDTPRCKNWTEPGSNSGPGPVQNLDPNENQLNDMNLNESGGADAPPPKTKRASQLPPDFALTDATKKWAADKGFPPHVVTSEVEKFCDWHTAKGNKFVDWQRAFMTWMRNSRDWGKAPAAPPSPTSLDDLRRSVGYQAPPPELRLDD